jgi:hypothetical protein
MGLVTLSVTVRVACPILPELTVKTDGSKDSDGASVSGGVILAVKVAVPWLPAASLAVAVQVTVIFSVTAGAVKTSLENDPSFVHEVSNVTTPTLSVAIKEEFAVPSELTVMVEGLNDKDGACVSAGGDGGVGGDGAGLLSSPPQETIAIPPTVITVLCNSCLMFIFFPHFFFIGIKQI